MICHKDLRAGDMHDALCTCSRNLLENGICRSMMCKGSNREYKRERDGLKKEVAASENGRFESYIFRTK